MREAVRASRRRRILLLSARFRRPVSDTELLARPRRSRERRRQKIHRAPERNQLLERQAPATSQVTCLRAPTRPEYLSKKLTPYPLPTKDGGVLRTIVTPVATCWQCRSAASCAPPGNTPGGYSWKKRGQQPSLRRATSRLAWT